MSTLTLHIAYVHNLKLPVLFLLCTEPVSPNRPREQVHHSNAKARREFISSALGPKSLPAQWNPTRAPNKGVWRLIYRQFFVSVTGVAGVTWLARQDERISCLFLVNMTQVLETVVWSLTICFIIDLVNNLELPALGICLRQWFTNWYMLKSLGDLKKYECMPLTTRHSDRISMR